MATFLLDGAESARLPLQPLVISMSVADARSGVRLTARSAGGPLSVIEDRPDLLIVPAVESEIVVSAVPTGGARQFAEGTILYLSIAPDTRDLNADGIQIASHEVSGRESVNLVKIAPSGIDSVIVTRIGSEDVSLPPLAKRARVACCGALGVDTLGSLGLSVACVVDASTSMARTVGDGTLGAAIEIVSGVAAAVAGEQPMRIVLAQDSYTEITSGPLTSARPNALEAISTRGFGIGADIDAAVAKVSETARFLMVITDNRINTLGAFPNLSIMTLAEAPSPPDGFVGAFLTPPDQDVDADVFYNARPELIDRVVSDLVAPLRSVLR